MKKTWRKSEWKLSLCQQNVKSTSVFFRSSDFHWKINFWSDLCNFFIIILLVGNWIKLNMQFSMRTIQWTPMEWWRTLLFCMNWWITAISIISLISMRGMCISCLNEASAIYSLDRQLLMSRVLWINYTRRWSWQKKDTNSSTSETFLISIKKDHSIGQIYNCWSFPIILYSFCKNTLIAIVIELLKKSPQIVSMRMVGGI